MNVWGAVRDRDDGSVPTSVTVRLTPESYDEAIHPPAATVDATPADTGAFTASIALAGVAEGPTRSSSSSAARSFERRTLRSGRS